MLADTATTSRKLQNMRGDIQRSDVNGGPDVKAPLDALGDGVARAGVALESGDDSQLAELVPLFNASVDACKAAGFTP